MNGENVSTENKISVEVGLQNISHPITFVSLEKAEDLSSALSEASTNGTTVTFTDALGRQIVINGSMIAYALIGTQEDYPLGFGAFNS